MYAIDDSSGFNLFTFIMTVAASNWILAMGLLLMSNVGLSSSLVKTS